VRISESRAIWVEAAILECERLDYGHRLYRYIDAQTQRDIDEGKASMMDALKSARPGLPMGARLKRLAVGLFEKAWRTGDFKACSQGLVEEAQVFRPKWGENGGQIRLSR